MTKIIVVTGRQGSGKSTLSRLICDTRDLKCVNVGDLLLAELNRLDLSPATRAAIGPRYLEVCGVEGYSSLILQHAVPGSVLDGVRIAEVLTQLRRSGRPVVNIFREGPPTIIVEPAFEGEIDLLRHEADVVVPWMASLDRLHAECQHLAEMST